MPSAPVPLLLAATAANNDPMPILLQYGVVGVLAVIGMLSTRFLAKRLEAQYQNQIAFLEKQLLSERERGDRLEERLRQIADATQQLLGGPLGDATRAIAEAMQLIRSTPRGKARRDED